MTTPALSDFRGILETHLHKIPDASTLDLARQEVARLFKARRDSLRAAALKKLKLRDVVTFVHRGGGKSQFDQGALLTGEILRLTAANAEVLVEPDEGTRELVKVEPSRLSLVVKTRGQA